VDRLLTSIALAPDSRGSFVEFDAVSVARRYMEEHFAEDLHVDDVAREAAISTSQLIRLFKRQLGTTPHSYLLRYRITQAKELLAETTLPVATIARQVGFASESELQLPLRRDVRTEPERLPRRRSPPLP
jgi:transcriptional regulator GlxA family with amidase domain